MSKSQANPGTPDVTISELRSINNKSDTEEFIDTAVSKYGLTWTRVGGMNNVGTIESGSSPKNGLGERETNGIDAIVERKALEKYGDIETAIENLPNTPREAVIELFDLPKSGLSAASQAKVSAMANRLRVILEESGRDERPTIVINDDGIGQHPDNFPDTFLNLHGDNKNTKPFLIGRFCQGGSNAYRPAEYTVIISRSYEGGPIGWTIVRRNKEHKLENGDTTVAYEYLTHPSGEVPRFDVGDSSSFEGTELRLVEYYAKGFDGSTESRLKRSNLAGVTGHQMFGSVYPFRVEDNRQDNRATTTVKGNRILLDDSKYVDKVDGERTQDRLQVPTDYGTLSVRYWIIDPGRSSGDDTKRAIINRFVDPSNPIVFTLSGQLHHEEEKRTLAKTEFGFLKDRMIVEVDFDALEENRRDLVFSSTRDRAMEGEEYDHIKSCLIDALQADDGLQALNEHYNQKALEGGDSADEANEDLADLMSSYDIGGDDVAGPDIPGAGGDDGPSTSTGKSVTGPSGSWSPEPVPNRKPEPTFMEIANPEKPLKPRQCGSLSVRLKLDAIDAFDDRDDVVYEAILGGDAASALTKRSERPLKKGHRYITFAVHNSVDVGTTGTLSIKLSWNGGDDTLIVARDLEVGEPKEWSETKDSTGSVSPKVVPHKENTSDAPFSNGTESVVEYIERKGEPDQIHVALFNQHVDNILDKVTRSENTLNRYAREYMAHIAFYAVMHHQEMAADDDETVILDEEGRLQELNRYAWVLMQAIAKNVDPTSL